MSMSIPTQIYSDGTVTEAFKFENAGLALMDYDDKRTLRFLQFGEFVLNIVLKTTKNIVITVCMVGDLQIPIAMDVLVVRIGSRSFAIAMPGLLYGLQFPPRCSKEAIDRLEALFIKFSYYTDLNDGIKGYPCPENKIEFWHKTRAHIEPLVHRELTRLFGYIPVRRSSPTVSNQPPGMLKAVRMSAASKLISNAMVSGSLKLMHMNIDKPIPPEGRLGKGKEVNMEAVFGSVSVFTILVEALESVGVVSTGCSGHVIKKNDGGEFVGLFGCKMWRLNRDGILNFMRILKTAVYIEESRIKENSEAETSESRK